MLQNVLRGLIAIVAIAGCGGGHATPPNISPLGIVPEHVTVRTGASVQFEAAASSATLVPSRNSDIVWSCDGGTIRNDGAWTAPSTPGTYHVVATSAADAMQRAIALATVVGSPPLAVVISPEATTVSPLAGVRFTASVTGAYDTRVVWSADAGTIQQDGSWVAPQTAGAFHVTARSIADPTQFAVATATVARPLIEVSVTPSQVTLGAGGRPFQFTAHVAGASDTGVVWSLAWPVAANTVDANGVFTPGPDTGFFQVVATSHADPSRKAYADVTIQPLLKDAGGLIVPASRTFAIWWGDAHAFVSDARAALESMLRGLNGSAYFSVLDQYARGQRATTVFGGSMSDPSPPPSTIDGTLVVAEVCRLAASNGLSLQDGDVFIVNTSNAPAEQACAWHSWGTCNGYRVIFAYIPNPHGTYCTIPNDMCKTGYSGDARSAVVSAAHELIEIITDALGTAWAYAGQEAVDICGDLSCEVIGNRSTQVTTMYSNAALACVSH